MEFWNDRVSIFKVAELGMKLYSLVNSLSVHAQGKLP